MYFRNNNDKGRGRSVIEYQTASDNMESHVQQRQRLVSTVTGMYGLSLYVVRLTKWC